MEVKRINDRLKRLYLEDFPILTYRIIKLNDTLSPHERATNPLLLKIDEKYLNSSLRVMFFGQETNYWHKELTQGEFHGKVEPLIDLYENFYLKGRCFSKGGQFWNGINRFRILIKDLIPKEIRFIWNNVIKIGKCGKGTPNHQIQEIQLDYFNVTQKEIEILNPDDLVFFSGPNYDQHLDKVISVKARTKIHSFTERQLCRIWFNDGLYAYRTYHPNYLFRNNINEYLDPIVSQIKTLHNMRYN